MGAVCKDKITICHLLNHVKSNSKTKGMKRIISIEVKEFKNIKDYLMCWQLSNVSHILRYLRNRRLEQSYKTLHILKVSLLGQN